MDGVTDVGTIEHVRTVEHRERRRKLNWKQSIFIDVYQFRCSCGWHTGWVENRERGETRANAHSFAGQLAADWPV